MILVISEERFDSSTGFATANFCDNHYVSSRVILARLVYRARQLRIMFAAYAYGHQWIPMPRYHLSILGYIVTTIVEADTQQHEYRFGPKNR